MGRPKGGLMQVGNLSPNYFLIDSCCYHYCGLADLVSMKVPIVPWRRLKRRRTPRLLLVAR